MLTVKIIPNDKGNPPGKLADAELHFTYTIGKDGALQHEPPDFVDADRSLDGLKLIGFGIWERRGGGRNRNVTFPARQYSINGERRSFALLRPAADGNSTDMVRALILEAYAGYEAAEAQADAGEQDVRAEQDDRRVEQRLTDKDRAGIV